MGQWVTPEADIMRARAKNTPPSSRWSKPWRQRKRWRLARGGTCAAPPSSRWSKPWRLAGGGTCAAPPSSRRPRPVLAACRCWGRFIRILRHKLIIRLIFGLSLRRRLLVFVVVMLLRFVNPPIHTPVQVCVLGSKRGRHLTIVARPSHLFHRLTIVKGREFVNSVHGPCETPVHAAANVCL